MQILLANAKIMYSECGVRPQTEPLFQTVAEKLAREMAECDIATLARGAEVVRL